MLKLVTVLFADVAGSTARAEKLHPEDVRALMSELLADGDMLRAQRELTAALQVFEQLGSVQEAERARRSLADIAV